MYHYGAAAGRLCLLGLAACGGVASLPGSTGNSSADPADASAGAGPGVRPIDVTGQPSTLVMSCGSVPGPIALSLPCQVGIGLDVTECDLAGPQDMAQRLPPISLIVPLNRLAGELNTPLKIPFENVPLPPGGYGSIAAYPGERFSGTLEGTVIFSQVDPATRAFVGKLQQARFDWTGNAGHTFSCAVADGPFWAVAGNFE